MTELAVSLKNSITLNSIISINNLFCLMKIKQVLRIALFEIAVLVFFETNILSQTPVPSDQITVSGIIHDKYNYPLPSVQVRVFDKDLRAEKQLGTTVSNIMGFYSVTFNGALAYPEYKSPDIFIKVYRGSTLLDQSEIYFNVTKNTTINYKIGVPPFKEINEFENLYKKVNKISKPLGINLGQLIDTGSINDITFLSGDLSEDFDKIFFLNKAFERSQNILLASVYYGMFRTGITISNDKNSNKLTSIILTKSLTQAVEQNIISSEILEKLDATIRYLLMIHTAR